MSIKSVSSGPKIIVRLLCLILVASALCSEQVSAIPQKSVKQPPQKKATAPPNEEYWLRINKAQNCLNQNRVTLAIKLCSDAIAIAPDQQEAYLLRAMAFRRNEQFNAALADADRAVEIKKSAVAYLERGSIHNTTSHHTLAVKDFTKCLELDPKNNRAYMRRAMALEELGDFKSALADMNKLIQNIPDRPEGYFSRGHIHMGLNEPLKAIADFDKTLSLDQNPVAHFNKASCLVQTDRPGDAILEYNRALAARPNMTVAIMNRGRTYVLLGKPDLAIADFTRVLSKEPNNELLYLFRGRAYQMKGDLNRANEDLKQATLKETDFAVSHFESGVENLLQENPEALPKKAAPKINPDVLIRRALVFQESKNYTQALATLDKAMSMAPVPISILITRGKLLLLMKRNEDALQSFTAAWRRQNMDTEAIHGRVDAFKAMGDYVHTLPDLNKLIWYDPNCPQYYFEKAEMLNKVNRQPDALKNYKKFLAMVDEHKKHKEKLITRYSINAGDVQRAKAEIAMHEKSKN